VRLFKARAKYPIDTVLDPSVAARLDEVTNRLELVVQQLTNRLDEYREDDPAPPPKRAPRKAAAKKAAPKKKES
jgi:RNA processing factor Prp31